MDVIGGSSGGARRGIPAVGLMILLTASMVARAAAAGPQVQFDCGTVVACRDVTSGEFLAAHPDQRIVEATFEVSTRVVNGNAKNLTELLFELHCPHRRASVVRLFPETLLEAESVEPVRVTETKEKQQSLGIALDTKLSPAGTTTIELNPSGKLGASRRNVVTEEILRLPVQEPVVISGTTDFRNGAFFKFKPSTQTSWEGLRELSCQFMVPAAWRGDWILVSCRARGVHNKYFVSRVERSGEARYVVGLYLVGDAVARQAAVRLADAQAGALAASGQGGSERGLADGPSELKQAAAALGRLAEDR